MVANASFPRTLRPIVHRRRATYADGVIEAVRMAIVRGVFPPGSRLSEAELARQLGVSRTPVREAIRALEKDGLLQRAPGQGLSIADISVDDVEEIYTIKTVLEGTAVRLACRRATEKDLARLYRFTEEMQVLAERGEIAAYAKVSREFHAALIRVSRSRRLAELYQAVDTPIQRLRVYALSQPGRPLDSVREHRAIIDAIAGRDPEQAERLIRSHVGGAGAILARVFHDRGPRRQEDE